MTTLISEIRYSDGVRFNLAPGTKKFTCKFLEPGFVSYREKKGGKLELLRKATIDAAMESVVGNPLIIGHTYVDESNRRELEQGRVEGWYYNSDDGWYYVTGTADTDEAVSLIRRGHKPSCGYDVLELAPGGVDHGIRYDQELSRIQFNHLAIVESPRYAGSDFRLNSLPKMQLFKFLKKLVTRENDADGKPVESVKTEATEISGETEIDIDGQKIRLNELFQTYLTETAAAMQASPEDAIEISGKAVTMGELAEAHRKKVARENAAAKVIADKEAADKATRENEAATAAAAEAAAKEAADKAARENQQAPFFTLHSARSAGKADGGFSTTSGSLKEKCELGAKRY